MFREKMKLIAWLIRKGDADTTIDIMSSKKAKDPDFFFSTWLIRKGG